MERAEASGRRLGLAGATLVGVGAIVGGGVLALAGVAFERTGPSAMLAFALNGAIAALTALAFAEMSATFPESGGTYTFAKKVLSVEVAFMVGWVVWFASIVAAVLYALGFSAFAITVCERSWPLVSDAPPPEWLQGRPAVLALAVAATAVYALDLVLRQAGGGRWSTVGKVALFVVVIAGGLAALASSPPGEAAARLTPFFARGGTGLLQAMGYTFIALQGFDLIAAVGGEVRDPQRNLPRAMLLSLGIALVVYIPLLFCVSTVGLLPGETVGGLAAANPATVIAVAAERFLGPAGWWLVVAGGLLAMLSALQANLYGASRVAHAMARDRTLPPRLARQSAAGTPAVAVAVTAVAVVVLAGVVPDLAAAGAAASLIFLVSFALAHWTSVLARRRGATPPPFRTPLFPLVPVVGATCCLGLALYQGFAVPAAGILATLWLGLGVTGYLTLLAPRARVADAASEGFDPELVRLRGRTSLVLVPIANPASARGLVGLAGCMAPGEAGRVLLLSVVRPPTGWEPGATPRELTDAQAVVGESLAASFGAELTPEALVTIADDPWAEIARVARAHRCASVLLGLPRLEDGEFARSVEELVSSLACRAAVLRAPPGWQVAAARRVLVPVGGRRDQSEMRARILGHLQRAVAREVTYMVVLSPGLPEVEEERARRELRRLARDELAGPATIELVRDDDVGAAVARRAATADLVILGFQRQGPSRKTFGDLSLRLARETETPLLFVSRRR